MWRRAPRWYSEFDRRIVVRRCADRVSRLTDDVTHDLQAGEARRAARSACALNVGRGARGCSARNQARACLITLAAEPSSAATEYLRLPTFSQAQILDATGITQLLV